MRPLSASELLSVWERAATQSAHTRALMLLAAACPDESLEELERLSIGRRDLRLLTLREWMFGPELNSVIACAACAAKLELNLTVRSLKTRQPKEQTERLSLSTNGLDVEFRVPNSLDLEAAARVPDFAAARTLLLDRCLERASLAGQSVAAADLPADVVDAIANRMAAADPQADLQLALECPSCGHRWQALFDIARYSWREIDGWAVRILKEVHTLARAYCWAEADILSMTPVRRRAYLDLVLA